VGLDARFYLTFRHLENIAHSVCETSELRRSGRCLHRDYNSAITERVAPVILGGRVGCITLIFRNEDRAVVRVSQSSKPSFVLMFEGERDSTMTDQRNVFTAHLHIATFCEKVLREADGVLSLIRIFDRFNVTGEAAEMPPSTLKFMVVISFKSGFMRGKQKIWIRPKSPTGKELPSMEFPTLFEGDDDRGSAIAFEINWIVDEEGVYWWDIYLNEEMVTRMPLRVGYQRIQMAIPSN